MELTSHATSYLSLLAPLVAIGLAVLTRRVLPALAVGSVVGALLLNGGQPLTTAADLARRLIGVFWTLPESSDVGLGEANSWNLSILTFLLLLGAMVALVTLSGGTRAFGEWARERVRTRRGAQLTTVLLGAIIFIDDYFNSLAVGNISRPLTDRQGISRAKLAYLIDSTAAPICVITPISSWGAYIISLVGGVLAAHAVTDITALQAFLEMSALNFYAISALVLVIASAWLDLNLGAMRRHADMARKGDVFDGSRGEPPGNLTIEEAEGGRTRDLLLPILTLVAATVAMILYTGASALSADGQAFSLLGAFEQTDVATSLLIGGAVALIATLALLWPRSTVRRRAGLALLSGIHSMLPAVYILVLAWLLTGIISDLGTGAYLASLVEGVLAAQWLPMLLFVLAGIMAFATGTSWGTFGIMLPIAGDMAAATDIAMLLPMMGAVLAGAVFGDHCSPISDTTILSSTGAACHHIDHVLTQLPYAGLGALSTLAGYLTLGLTGSGPLGLMVTLAVLALAVAWQYRRPPSQPGA
ncbi:Na+/H+ antiporter NhaC family protein [Onishia niordana]|uniref:Na+/H+ antiporter NhaC family protein n=1 Tax=Onishia niordana TaxID=2508711 RepID=UPI00109F421E|nr:Na+/H+ antiporter NhaC family protein [Halomonas niordiana]